MPDARPYSLFLIRSPSPVEVGFGSFPTHAKAVDSLVDGNGIHPQPLDLWMIQKNDTPVSVGYYDEQDNLVVARKALINTRRLVLSADYRYAYNVLYDVGGSNDLLRIIFKKMLGVKRFSFIRKLLLDAANERQPGLAHDSIYFLELFRSFDTPVTKATAREQMSYYRDFAQNNHLTQDQKNLFLAVADYYRMQVETMLDDKGYYFLRSISTLFAYDGDAIQSAVKSVLSFPAFMRLL